MFIALIYVLYNNAQYEEQLRLKVSKYREKKLYNNI